MAWFHGQLQTGDFDCIVKNLTAILFMDIATQLFKQCVIDTIDNKMKKKFGLVSFFAGRTFGGVIGDCCPESLVDLPVPGPKRANTRAEMVAAFQGAAVVLVIILCTRSNPDVHLMCRASFSSNV